MESVAIRPLETCHLVSDKFSGQRLVPSLLDLDLPTDTEPLRWVHLGGALGAPLTVETERRPKVHGVQWLRTISGSSIISLGIRW